MNKALDPTSVGRTETPSASYVLRRRYRPARHVITVASWVTVISMLFQPVAALAATQYWDTNAGTWDTATFNWSPNPGGGSLTTWTDNNDAVFSAGVGHSGTFTITISGTRAANSVAIEEGTLTFSGGTALQIGTGGLTLNNGIGATTISTPITLNGSQIWTHNDDSLLTVQTGTLTLGANTLTVGGSGNTIISAPITGTGSLTKTGNGTATINNATLPSFDTITLSGGTLALGSVTRHTFTSSGPLTIPTGGVVGARILVVGGGGGGGALGGGGGGGAVVYIPSASVDAGDYTVTVGGGGLGGTTGADGAPSSVNFGSTITAIGGGGGGAFNGSGRNGGSGGGEGAPGTSGNSAIGGIAHYTSSLGGFTGTIYGNAGGNITGAQSGNTFAAGGGGAGVGEAGSGGGATAGPYKGGNGIAIDILGTSYYWGGGGGGGAYDNVTGGTGGLGGGGGGGRQTGTSNAAGGGSAYNPGYDSNLKVGGAGGANTGGGGGGGAYVTAGGAGGSGIVIVAWGNAVNLPTTHVDTTANSTLDLVSVDVDHTLGRFSVAGGQTLTIANAKSVALPGISGTSIAVTGSGTATISGTASLKPAGNITASAGTSLSIAAPVVIDTAGTRNVSGNVTMASLDLSSATGTVNAANPLAISSTLKVKDGSGGVVTGTYTKGSGPDTFSASGSDLANDSTLTLGGGTLSLIKYPSTPSNQGSGGEITISGGKVIHTFKTPGSGLSLTGVGTTTAEVLVVGGGGSGRGNGSDGSVNSGSGGYGGQVLYDGNYSINGDITNIEVGAGGVAAINASNPGGNSTFGTITATGGLGGTTVSNGSGPGGYGNGGANIYDGFNGGIGVLNVNSITGIATYYGGGGGAGTTIGGTGGLGGGGHGKSYSNNANGGVGDMTAGGTNTGGGGGGRSASTSGAGANGGSGIIIVSYPVTYLPISLNLSNIHIAATASSTLDLGALGENHILGNVSVTAGAGANTTLTVNNVNSLTIGTLTARINGAYCGKLDLGTKALTLGNGSVPKLVVTSVSPTVTECCVAVAANGSFTGLHGNQVTETGGRKWKVEVRASGTELWLVAAFGGTVIMIR